MKLKNIKVGDTVEAKTDIVIRKFAKASITVKAGTLCKVVSRERANYAGRLSVEVASGGITDWCNHNDLRKPRPKIRTLDQSVFEEEPEHIRWAMITSEGALLKLEFEPAVLKGLWTWTGDSRQGSLIGEYDSSDWQNSLIGRAEGGLTGDDLCRAMLERGDRIVLCLVTHNKVSNTVHYDAITHWSESGVFVSSQTYWNHAVPVTNQGQILTAKEAGF